MLELISQFWTVFSSSEPFIPHGHCYLWKTYLVWLHITSDGLIALAYYSIPATLFYFVNKRQDLPFGWIFLLFSAFIVACGTTHIIEIWTLWHPTYWVSGFAKAGTAIISLITAVQLVPLVPKALALPSPAQLEKANQELQIQIAERLRVEDKLRKYQNHLEELVVFRTSEITKTNEQLQQEIIERQRILENLRQSEERYRYLAEAIPQLVWTSNANGECDYFNQNWHEYTGLTLEESLGSGWLAALNPDDVQNGKQAWSDAVRSGTLYENEYRFKRVSDGSYRWQLARALPLKDEKGQIVKWFGTCTDIHEQKEILKERAYLLKLEQKAREEAEKANQIKDEFLAVLGHELRTPLNAILGWSQLLRTRNLDQERTFKALATIERNAKLQVQLIEDLLDISRILQGKLTLNITNVNLESVVLSALETMRLAAEAKLIQVNTGFEPNLGQVVGDSTRLQQVIWNILSNAVKFTPQGGRVEVVTSQVDGYVQIMISDTGKGISAEFLPYVFDYFRQADSTSTRKFGGLGLGLAIANKIVEMHGGTITAESLGEGRGATFTVRFPVIPTQAKTNQETKQPDCLPDFSGVKVLLVEDDEATREFFTFLLQIHGAIVTPTASAIEALTIIAQFQPDVLLSDIGMEQMDGYMLIQQVRNLPPEAGGLVPAIALTAYAGEFNQKQALRAGFQMHLSKPVDPDELIRSISNLISNCRGSF